MKNLKNNNPKIKYLNLFFLVTVIFSVFFIVILSSLFSYLYNINYYDKKYQQYGIYEKFTKEQALNETKNIFGYLQYKNELDMNFFNKNEESHLNDVRLLIQKIYNLYFFSMAIFWGVLFYYFLFSKKELIGFFSRMIFYSGIVSLSVLLFFVIIYFVIGFDTLFNLFHKILFTGNYAFNPLTSNMKALFPDSFFLDIAFSTLLRTFFKSILLIIMGFYLVKKIK